MQTDVFENVQVNVNDLPSIEGLHFMPLEKAYLKILLLNSIIVFAVLFIGLIIVWFFDKEGGIRQGNESR